MAYFKIGATDYSNYVSGLKVNTVNNYTALNNAAGNTVVDFINAKRTIEVSIIPLNATAAKGILSAISAFNVSLSFLNPNTNVLESNVNCIIPETEVEYYTIQVNNVKTKALNLTFIEL